MGVGQLAIQWISVNIETNKLLHYPMDRDLFSE